MKKSWMVNLEPELHRKLKILSATTQKKMKELLEEAISYLISKYEGDCEENEGIKK